VSNTEAPSRAEFNGLAGLLEAQRGYLGTLGTYAGRTCGNADGLDNALGLLRHPVADLSTFMNDKLFGGQGGIGYVAAAVRDAGTLYHSTDHQAEQELRGVFPVAPAYFPEIGTGPVVGNYDDVKADAAEPADSAEDTIRANLNHVMSAPGTVEHIWQWVTGGDSLLERLVTPIVGNYGRLRYLSAAYANLGDAAYTVAGNLRRGTYRMAPQWNGAAAKEFEFLMFRWHMGIGGLGDLAQVAATVFKDGYDTIAVLVNGVLDAIGVFINHELKKLMEAAAGTAAIEAIGGGPEDPLADVVAAGWDAWKIYQALSYAITAIHLIIDLIGKLIEGVKKLAADIAALRELATEIVQDPDQVARDTLAEGLNRAAEFEKDGYWDPRLGAARICLLPSS
jgi:uncharacterized protein YukE